MLDGAPLWIDERDAAALLTMGEAIDVLADAYRLQADGRASSMRRAHLREDDAILHAVGGSIPGAEVAGVKTWLYTPRGAEPLLVLFSLDDGGLLGIVEAFAMGQMRTAATSGLATRVLAPEHVDTLALLGTGKQAFAQAQAVAAVRPLRHVRLFGRDAQRRGALAGRLAEELQVDVSEHADAAAAIDDAQVVTTITRASEPFVDGAMLRPGAHVNAVGAIVPTRRELAETAVARFDAVVVDSLEQAREDAGELRAAAERGLLDWSTVRGLDAVVAAGAPVRRAASDLTLFKALGVGLADVALGAELVRRAHAAGAGQPLARSAPIHH
jgi:ornithine cyclodeaminase